MSSPSIDGEGDHTKGGGGVAAVISEVRARTFSVGDFYPSTMLRMVPLPTASRRGG
jgi:hypothetical protein